MGLKSSTDHARQILRVCFGFFKFINMGTKEHQESQQVLA